MSAPDTQSPKRERNPIGSNEERSGSDGRGSGSFELDKRPDGVAVLWFDCPDQSVNTLGEQSLTELDETLGRIAKDREIQGLIIASRKPGCFIAGADISEIQAIVDPKEGAEKAARGQSILNRIEDLEIPTVAAIGGVCLGGGAELALCCRYRVAGEGPKFRMGFPEVNLGILPAFGGTYRLPRLLGVPTALDVILTGRGLVAKKALKIGLVDRVVPEKGLLYAALEVVRAAIEAARGGPAPKWGRPRVVKGLSWFLERTPVGRSLVYNKARSTVLARSGGHYPAPLAVLDLMPTIVEASRSRGLSLEAETLGKLVVTPVSKNLLRLFFLNEGAKKVGRKGASDSLTRVGVIGAGVMGAGIASLLIRKGLTVRLVDISPEALGRGLKSISAELEKRVLRRRMTKTEAEHAFARLAPSTRFSDLKGLPFVIEAAVEDLKIKRKIVADLGELNDGQTLFATNTSSIPLGEIASDAPSNVSVVGMHFFNPVERMPLVEVMETGKERVGDGELSEEAQVVLDLSRRIGKVALPVGDVPGFLVNRILSPYLGEAVTLVTEGAAIGTIDRCMKEFGMPMGPLRLLDEVGLDVAQHVSAVLDGGEEGKRFKAMIDWLVQRGRLGKKAGRGFYLYRGRGKKAKEEADGELTMVVRELFGVEEGATGPSDDAIRDRLLLSLLAEAGRALEEGVVSDAANLDLAMIMGTGFPPFRGGLLRYAEQSGVAGLVEKLKDFASVEGPRYRPAELLVRVAEDKGTF